MATRPSLLSSEVTLWYVTQRPNLRSSNLGLEVLIPAALCQEPGVSSLLLGPWLYGALHVP